MKAKSIILSGLLLLTTGAATTSCEDMFTPENKNVEDDLAVRDTVYQMMGIVKQMQVLADRTNLLGEIRADLVDLTERATKDIQELSQNNIGENNAYNQPADYYAVINSCNIYLKHADSLLMTHNEYYYRKEIIAAKCFRAWCYLELAKNYDQVPFVTEPVTTADAADKIVENTKTRKGMIDICTFAINDLLPYADIDENKELLPSYGSSYGGVSYSKFFIPFRLMLGELYLWRGTFTQSTADYREAIRYYHDYLAFPNEPKRTLTSTSSWNRAFDNVIPDYSSAFQISSNNDEIVAVMPLDTIDYYGNHSDLFAVYNSTYAHYYYPMAVPSKRVMEISNDQTFCYYDYQSASQIDTLYAPTNPAQFNSIRPVADDDMNPQLFVGDLRLTSVYNTWNYTDMYHSNYSTNKQTIQKLRRGNAVSHGAGYNDERIQFVPLYRTSIIYLHFAEALNRAGFPEAAFAILKYGISTTVLSDPNLVDSLEYQELQTITSRGFAGEYANAAGWDPTAFITFDKANDPQGLVPGRGQSAYNQRAIHSYGSGSTWCDPTYVIPDANTYEPLPEANLPELTEESTAEDSLAYDAALAAYEAEVEAVQARNAELKASTKADRIKAVDRMILDEEALEGMFEGQRYYDLMRYSMYNNGNYTYLINAVNQRAGKDSPATIMTPDKVYLPLRKR